MKMKYHSLVINPGSTSTKIAVFQNDKVIIEKNITHSNEELKHYPTVLSQKDFRRNIIEVTLIEAEIDIDEIDFFIGRGGLLKPLLSGTYLITQKMIDDLVCEKYGSHAANLGAILAYELASLHHKKAYTVDPVVVDELSDLARVSGLKGITRKSVFHALNQKAVAKRYAKSIGTNYQDLNLIVAHLGGGISIGLHQGGQVVDVNDALGGQGPFSPERAGGLPVNQIIELCFSNQITKEELMNKLIGQGGLVSYLGTNDGLKIRQMIYDNDELARFYLEAMSYQVAKEIGGLYFVAKGNIDAIILTGGSAHNEIFIQSLKNYLELAKEVVVIPGENEMLALVSGVLRIINNEEELQEY